MTTFTNYLSRKLLGKRLGDIELPNKSGKTDPRLTKPDISSQLRKAWRVGRDLTDDNDSTLVERLQRAGQRAVEREKQSR
jgi:hypothetical protein